MNTPTNNITVNNIVNEDVKRPMSVPLNNRDSHQDKNIEDFLNDIVSERLFIKDGDLESETISLNDDIRSVSAMSRPEEINDTEEVFQDTSVHVHKDSEPIHGSQTSVIESPQIIDDPDDRLSNFEEIMVPSMSETVPLTMYCAGKSDKPIKVTTHHKIQSDITLDAPEKTTDFQLFAEQLSELSQTIQRKDEEIKRLSQRLLELEYKKEKPNGKLKKVHSKSPSTSSSDSENDNEKNSSEISNKNDEKDCQLKMEKAKVQCTQERSNLPEEEGLTVKDCFIVKKEEKLSVADSPIIMRNDDIIPDLRQKLCALEDEVKRLHQANIDSLLYLEDIQNKNPVYDTVANDSLIKQLLVDHNLLKDELDQLKRQHSKLAQPSCLGEEIKQLKVEVNGLRNQNEQLQKYVKTSSSKSPNKIPNTVTWKGSYDNFDDQFKGQSKEQTVQRSDIEKYRARKLSDTSSALVEDITPKLWLEPVNDKLVYQRRTNHSDLTPRKRDNRDFDQCSVDSFVSVTTSVTDENESYRKYPTKHNNRTADKDQVDLLSTVESDTLADLSDQEGYSRTPKYSYSFTPKSAADLTLDDLVKFARPGGKMSTGRVCFVGHLTGRREMCVGLELDEDAGKHDGMFEGVRYFQCRKNRGVFISFHKIILAYKSI